ncbi:MAG TPA: MaoC family dehydratase [Dehalococcoidia bacterium]|nr:MaoC family dehydratase [Dehalococcoidia bacterium]
MSQAEPTVESVRRTAEALCLPYTVEIERRMIKKFAEAVGDTNPLWTDEEAAKHSEYGGIILPPTFFCSVLMAGISLRLDSLPPLSSSVDGGSDWQFFLPVRPGDTISVSAEITEVKERQGKLGRMFFIYWRAYYRNQRGELVAQSDNTVIYY